jgi:hypothetical protein
MVDYISPPAGFLLFCAKVAIHFLRSPSMDLAHRASLRLFKFVVVWPRESNQREFHPMKAAGENGFAGCCRRAQQELRRTAEGWPKGWSTWMMR